VIYLNFSGFRASLKFSVGFVFFLPQNFFHFALKLANPPFWELCSLNLIPFHHLFPSLAVSSFNLKWMYKIWAPNSFCLKSNWWKKCPDLKIKHSTIFWINSIALFHFLQVTIPKLLFLPFLKLNFALAANLQSHAWKKLKF